MIEFLDEVGLDEFYNLSDKEIGESLDSFFTTELYGANDEELQVLTAKSFMKTYEELTASIEDLKRTLTELNELLDNWYHTLQEMQVLGNIQIVTGPIEERVKDPNIVTLYCQHDNVDDRYWTIYIYKNHEWKSACDLEAILSRYATYSEMEDQKELVKTGLVEYVEDGFIIDTINNEYAAISA